MINGRGSIKDEIASIYDEDYCPQSKINLLSLIINKALLQGFSNHIFLSKKHNFSLSPISFFSIILCCSFQNTV